NPAAAGPGPQLYDPSTSSLELPPCRFNDSGHAESEMRREHRTGGGGAEVGHPDHRAILTHPPVPAQWAGRLHGDAPGGPRQHLVLIARVLLREDLPAWQRNDARRNPFR